ncbi:MAG TPA: hypothetical protein VFE21_01275 [Rubrobacteraceae bacterium]|nr:hypothetical protein [Rubrobacteraceae bacterium]
MEALDFLADYSLCEESGGRHYLETGDGRIPLYPFITPATCPRCGSSETYFVGAWDTRKGTVRLKSFENGHTIDSTEVSEALADWTNVG